MRTGDQVDVEGVTIVVESITYRSGSITASIRWEDE
jgi:small-conductance mechanosensitive channel